MGDKNLKFLDTVSCVITLASKTQICFHMLDIFEKGLNRVGIQCLLMHSSVHSKHEVSVETEPWGIHKEKSIQAHLLASCIHCLSQEPHPSTPGHSILGLISGSLLHHCIMPHSYNPPTPTYSGKLQDFLNQPCKLCTAVLPFLFPSFCLCVP